MNVEEYIKQLEVEWLKFKNKKYLENLYFEGEYTAYLKFGASQDEAIQFYNLLTAVLTEIGNGKEVSLPEDTSLHSLPDFVALKMPTGVKALYNLGFRTGKYKEKYCYIINPDKIPILYDCNELQHYFNELWVELVKIESLYKNY